MMTDDDIECLSCGVTIPEFEFNALDEKYQHNPKCETCFREEESS